MAATATRAMVSINNLFDGRRLTAIGAGMIKWRPTPGTILRSQTKGVCLEMRVCRRRGVGVLVLLEFLFEPFIFFFQLFNLN